jgi:hypothetical protein
MQSLATSVGLSPLGSPVDRDASFWTRHANQIAWAFVVVGVAARLIRYLLRFPLWGDEYMLAENLLYRDYAGLFQPLDHCQVAPILYLLLEMTSVKLVGFNEWGLRFVAAVSGIASVFLFRHLAARLLRGVPMMLAVGIFAVSYYPIRHSAEVKPYGSDCFAALVLLVLAVEWLHSRPNVRWLWALALATPPVIGLSFPALFVAGGVSLALLVTVWRSSCRRTWIAYGAYHVALLGAFAVTFWLSTGAQQATLGAEMRDHWRLSFPPSITEPGNWALWMLNAHTGEMFAYPVGGDAGGSVIPALLVLLGAIVLWRKGERSFVIATAGTLALAFIAACLKRYPYGDNERLVQYVAPLACTLAGLGAATAISAAWWAWARRGWLATATSLLAVVGFGMIGRDLTHPYKYWRDWYHQGFARWFWNQNPADGEMVCVHSDLGRSFTPEHDTSGYFCYQRIYSPRHHHATLREPIVPPTGKPIRCVVFGYEFESRDEQALNRWLAEMSSTYDLAGHQSYKVLIDPDEHQDVYGVYEVYRFVPKQSPTPAIQQAKITTQKSASYSRKRSTRPTSARARPSRPFGSPVAWQSRSARGRGW